MKLIAVIESIAPEYGGPSSSLPQLLGALSKRGYEVEIFTCDLLSKEIRNHHIDSNNLKVTRCNHFGPSRGKFSLSLYNHINSSIKIKKPVAIYSNNLWNYPAWAAHSICERQNIPHIIAPRSSLLPRDFAQRKALKLLAMSLFQKRALNNCAFIHSTSAEETEEIRALGIVRPIYQIPHAVERSLLEYQLTKTNAAKFFNWLDPRKKYALYLGRLHKKKGIEDLLEAWRAVWPSNTNWTLVIAGPPEDAYSKMVTTAAAELGDFESIIMAGFIAGEQKMHLLNACDILVAPSHWENFGMVVAEGLASQLPVITTTATPWPDITKLGLGELIDPGDINALIAALKNLLRATDKERRDMGARGKEYIAENFSWDASADAFHNAIASQVM